MSKSQLPSLFDDTFFNRSGRHFVGFDHLFRDFDNFFSIAEKVSYPPYNIKRVQNEDNETFVIEMALAGFSEENISVEQTDDRLIVQSRDIETSDDEGEILHRGIALRQFSRQFRVPQGATVSARMENGMLLIEVETPKPHVPETKAIPILS